MALQYKSKSIAKFERLSEEEILRELFRLRGIENMEEFLEIGEHNIYDGMLFKNMKKGLQLYHKHILNNSKVLILVD